MSDYIMTKTSTTLSGEELILKYFFRSGGGNYNRRFQNWFSINKNRFELQDNQYVGWAKIIQNNDILIRFGYFDEKKCICNFKMYNLKGGLLWIIEPPRFTDGTPIERGYMFHRSREEWYISKNNYLIFYVPDRINMDQIGRTKRESDFRNAIHYEVDIKTGKIVHIHEGLIPDEFPKES